MTAAGPGGVGLIVLLVLALGPMVMLLPEPPAHLRVIGGAALAAGLGGAVWRHAQTSLRVRRSMRATAAWLCLVTVAATAANIVLQPVFSTVPTLDVLPWAFGLQGEDIDDAVLFEAWFELWLLCLAVSGAPLLLARVARRLRGAGA